MPSGQVREPRLWSGIEMPVPTSTGAAEAKIASVTAVSSVVLLNMLSTLEGALSGTNGTPSSGDLVRDTGSCWIALIPRRLWW